MNKLTLPPCPGWVNNNIVTCSPDGILIYGSRNNNIVLVCPAKQPNEAADVKFIYHVTLPKERLIGVAIDTDNWPKEKYVASAGTDNVVKLWDVENFTLKLVNNVHKDTSGKCVAINFVNNTVISITDDGQISIWNVLTNSVRLLKNNLCHKVKISCMATSRLKPYLTCVGTIYGDVFVIQTKGKGKVLHRVKCEDSEITTLSFCPVFYNYMPQNHNIKKQEPQINQPITQEITVNKEEKIIKEVENLTNKLQTDCVLTKPKEEPIKLTKANVWSNLKFPDDDENIMGDDDNNSILDEGPSPTTDDSVNDFLEECSKLQKEIQKVCHNLSDDTSPISKKKIEKKNIFTVSDEPTADSTTYDFLDTSSESTAEKDENVIENVVEKNVVLTPSTSDANQVLDNLLLLKTLKNNVDASLASSLVVEVDESIDNETIDNVSEFSERDERTPDIQLNTPDSICEIEETTATMKNINLSSTTIFPQTDIFQNQMCLLLAVCSKYNSPSIWRIEENGRLSKQFQIPFVKRKNKPKRFEPIVKKSVYWATPTLILYSTDTGSLCAWDYFVDKRNPDQKSRLIHSDHKNKGIYAISTPYYIEEENGTLEKLDKWKNCVWTFGMDRSIICTSLSVDRTCLYYFPTANGFIYSISISPLDPNRVAIGCGDYTIRLFDISRPHTNIVNMTSVNQNIKSKVMVTTWHPTKENCLVFSLHDGKIGLMDPSAPTKPVVYLQQYTHSAIYSLTWGPLPAQPNQFFLYACADGACIAYDVKSKEKGPVVINFEKSDTLKISEAAWKPDYKILTLGSKDGTIIFLTPDFKVLCTIYDFKKSIQTLSWHPQMTAEDNEESKHSKYLAVGTYDSKVVVYDCENLLSGERPNIIAKLEGHTASINVVTWSPHSGNILMTGASDGTVRIWNVASKTLISTFYTGNSHIYTSTWSPFNSDIIMSGGRDCIFYIWKISENPPILDIIKPPMPSSSNASIENSTTKYDQKINETINDDNQINDKDAKIEITQKNKKSSYLPHLNCYQNTEDINTRLIEKLVRKFHDSETTENKENNDNVFELYDLTNLFGSADDVLKLLDAEQNDLKAHGRSVADQNISLWRGNFKPMIESAIEKKALTPWLVNLAPMVSIRCWRESCAAYAEQLIGSNNHLEALSYYLAINDVENGIKTLISGKYYKEALIIAKIRLSNDDPWIKDILLKWAEFSVSNGSIEIAAHCYITLGDLSAAAKILARRCNLKSLKIALDLAKRAENKDLTESIEIRIKEMTNEKLLSEPDSNSSDLKELPTRIELHLNECKKTENDTSLKTENEDKVVLNTKNKDVENEN